jgi:ABC-type glycerol-3-phosphate transport system substrate-binding protein
LTKTCKELKITPIGKNIQASKKEKSKMKKISVVFCIILIFLALPMSVYGQLKVWSFTDELADITKILNKSRPEIKIDYTQIPSDQFQAKIDPVLQSGRGAPDIIALENSFVRKYVESDLLLDLTDIYEANKDKLLAYPIEIGTYNGRVYAMSWQARPGAMFYRRSLAKKYLGTDDPKTVQTYFVNFDRFLKTAKLLNDKSKGSCIAVPSAWDLYFPCFSARKEPWIVNGKLVIDPAVEKYMDIYKVFYDNRWEYEALNGSAAWFAGMRGELENEFGKPLEVFSYFLTTWEFRYLKSAAPNTAGDWAMIQGPSPYHWGGTWIAAYKGTKNAAEVKEFIRYITTDEAFLETWAKDTGDIVSNINVINKIKDNYSESYLGGQNHYAQFAEIAKNVNGKLLQESDEIIDYLWYREAFCDYVNGGKTKAQALADFRSEVLARRE